MSLPLRWTIVLLVVLGPVPGIPGLEQFVEDLWLRPVPHLLRPGAFPTAVGEGERVLQARAPDQGRPDSPPPSPAFLITDPAAMPAAWAPTRTSWSPAFHRRAHSDGQTLWAGDVPGPSSAQFLLLAAVLVLGAPLLLAIGLRRVTPLRGPPFGDGPRSA